MNSATKATKPATSSQFGGPLSARLSSRSDGPLLPFRGIGGQHGDDVVDAARDAAAEVAGLEARRDGVGDDDLRQRVGQRAFEAVADLDPHPPLVRRDQQQHAVVLRLLAELPGAEQLVGVGLDLLALQRADGGDDELDAGLGLEIRELRLRARPARRRRNDVRPGRRRGR